jgi:hypothetical protein
MVKAVEWLLCAYLMLKLIQYFFVARPGFGTDDEPGVREKLLRGEPLVFIVAFAISVPPALWSSWYFQREYSRGFARSTDCYGRLSALVHLARVETRFDALQVYKTTKRANSSASLAAQWLELSPAFLEKALADKKSYYATRYASLSRQADRHAIGPEAGAIEGCLRNFYF